MNTPTIFVSKFPSATDTKPVCRELTWPQLRALFTKHKPVKIWGLQNTLDNGDPVKIKGILDSKKLKEPGIAPARFIDKTTRANANVVDLWAFIADIDDGFPLSELRERWVTKDGKPLAWIAFSTFKHRAEAPRVRIVFPLSKCVAASDWPKVWRKLAHHLTDNHIDPSTKEPARLHFLPACPEIWLDEAFADASEGEYLNPDDFDDPPLGADETDDMILRRLDAVRASGNRVGVSGEGDRPGDGYNAQSTIEDMFGLLAGGGWREERRSGHAIYVTRPGKEGGVSGVVGHPTDPTPCFYSFTSSDPVIQPGRQYDPFGLFATLSHGGDFAAAAKALAAQGFGTPAKTTKSVAAKVAQSEREKLADLARMVDSIEESDETDRPRIVTNARQEREIAKDAWRAIEAINAKNPLLFTRGRTLALLGRDRDGSVHTIGASPQTIAHLLRTIADMVTVRVDRKGVEIMTDARLPEWLPKELCADLDAPRRLPYLRSVVAAPVVSPSGELLTAPGYHPCGLFLDCAGVSVPKSATIAEAKAALARVFGLFGGFPYENPGDRANAIALLFTPFLRHYIDGPVPLCVIEAPAAGTGKTLLAKSILGIHSPEVLLQPMVEQETPAGEEWGKVLASILSQGPSSVVFDNLRGTIKSTVLESLLTAKDIWRPRKFGTNDTSLELDVSGVTWCATGNNAVFAGDMPRRCFFVRLDARMENPETRDDFDVPNLERHIQTHRAELLADVCLILRAWIDAGRPRGSAVKGSYESWAAILSGLLDLLGVPGFLSTDAERAAASNPEKSALAAFVSQWWASFGDTERSSKDLLDLAIESAFVGEKTSSIGLGRHLRQLRGVTVDGIAIQYHEGRTKTGAYHLRQQRMGAGVAGVAGDNLPPTREEKNQSIDTYTHTHTSRVERREISPATPATPAIHEDHDPFADGGEVAPAPAPKPKRGLL